MHLSGKYLAIVLLIGLGLAGISTLRARAQAGVGIINGTPLKIQIFGDNSLQVWHSNYTEGAAFGKAGSGFFLAVDTHIFGPFYEDMETVNQTSTQGQLVR